MASQYQQIKGVKYEREFITIATDATADGASIAKEQAVKLWKASMDGGRVTPTERKTIEYILETYKADEAAKTYLQEKLKGEAKASGDAPDDAKSGEATNEVEQKPSESAASAEGEKKVETSTAGDDEKPAVDSAGDEGDDKKSETAPDKDEDKGSEAAASEEADEANSKKEDANATDEKTAEGDAEKEEGSKEKKEVTKVDKLSMSLDELITSDKHTSKGGGKSGKSSGKSGKRERGGGSSSWGGGKGGSSSWDGGGKGGNSWSGGGGGGGGDGGWNGGGAKKSWKEDANSWASGSKNQDSWNDSKAGGDSWGSGGGDKSWSKSSWKDESRGGGDRGNGGGGRDSGHRGSRDDRGGRGDEHRPRRSSRERREPAPEKRSNGEKRCVIVAGIQGLKVARRDLEGAFGTVGRIEDAKVGESSAALTFKDGRDAREAVRRFHGGQLNDRTIDVYLEGDEPPRRRRSRSARGSTRKPTESSRDQRGAGERANHSNGGARRSRSPRRNTRR